MAYECFELSESEGVAHLKMSRPERRNAMTAAFWKELPEIVRGLQARVLVLSSTGPHFCAGLDVSLFQGNDSFDTNSLHGRLKFKSKLEELQSSLSSLAEAPFPVIAAVQGGCIGAGVDMTSACDIRYATEDAFFQIAEINIGMTADVGTFPRLCKLIPEGWVRELAYGGRRLPAAKAKEIGLVNDVFPTQEAMLAHVMELAAEIASKAPVAVAGSKRMINHARDHSIADGLDYIATWQAGMFSPPHMMEAFAAKAQKRAPEFPDLAPLRKKM